MTRESWSGRFGFILATVGSAVGIGSILSFNRWAVWFPLDTVDRFATATVYAMLDYLTSNVLASIVL